MVPDALFWFKTNVFYFFIRNNIKLLKILTSILFKLSSSETFVRHGIRSTAAVMVEPPCPLDVVATENCSIDDLVPFVHSSLVLRRNKILILILKFFLCSALAFCDGWF